MPHLDALFEAVDAELSHADLLVSHPASSIVGSMSCQLRGVPWVVGDLFPMLVPTGTAPPAGMSNLGSAINRTTWSAGRSRLTAPLTCRSGFVEFRDRFGLATPRSWNVIDARLSPHRHIALTSPHYVDHAPDWPDGCDLVGFTPWNGPDGGRLDAAPLLASARAVVHSGAHGTNALVLGAGLPSVIAPCMFDQRWHAQRQQQLGTGIWARHPRHLSKALHRLLTDRSIAAQAARIGDKLRAEDGTSAACDVIETML